MRIDPCSWPLYPACAKLFGVLSQKGGEARFVGGCVRDAILGKFLGDIDIACTHPPESTLTLLENVNIRAIPTGLPHGTVTAIIDGTPFEITTLREDIETHGRHATVHYTNDWKKDATRRDFTMNALYADLQGNIEDYFGGIEDARNGIVRFIGDANKRIEEDALRILRFFRFSAWYGHVPYEAEGLRACRDKAALIDNLSGERIQTEMLKLLASSNAHDVLSAMQETGILAHIGLTIFSQTPLKRLQEAELKLAALLREMPSPEDALTHLSAQWKLSRQLHKLLEALVVADLDRIVEANEKEQKKLLRANKKPLFIAQIKLASALLNKPLPKHLALAENWIIPAFPVTGDMLKSKGFAEGKALGEILRKLEARWEAADYAPSAEELFKGLD